MRRGVMIVVVLVLTAAGWLGHQAHTGARADLGQMQWLPTESHPGGAQYDPRLDRPVSFWGAGIVLPDVFASIKAQTGVEIGFWPPGDENERVRVNLFLNPEQPPALRDLMAQLSWVLGCAFSYEPAEEGDPRYCLLSTGIRFGVKGRLQAEQEEAERRGVVVMARREAELREQTAEKLEELRGALALSREDAVERYQGTEDALLLALLHTESRRTVEFVVGLGDEDLETMTREGIVSRPWEEWTPQQQAALRTILGDRVRQMRERGHEAPAGEPDWQWKKGAGPEIGVAGPSQGAVWVRADVPYERDGVADTNPVRARVVPLIRDGLMWNYAHIADLREALGEALTAEERDAIRQDSWAAWRQRREASAQEDTRAVLQSWMESQSRLSAGAASRLSAFLVPTALTTAYPLWQVQEVAARVSGMHVASDCFWQPPRRLREAREFVFPGNAPELTGLLVLKLLCVSNLEPIEIQWPYVRDYRAGWEWGDAGEFLRFRSESRDLWRAALLPKEVLKSVDAVVGPPVREALASAAEGPVVQVELDPAWASWLARRLDDMQLQHGGKMTYGDPADTSAACQQIVRKTALEAIAFSCSPFRFLATLSEGQWGRVWEEGLRWGEDLTPDQQKSEISAYVMPLWRQTKAAVIRLHENGRAQNGGTRGRRMRRAPNVSRTYGLEISASVDRLGPRGRRGMRFGRGRAAPGGAGPRPGTVSYSIALPRTIKVRPEAPARLTRQDVVGVDQ